MADKKFVWVTGASSGIGRSISKTLISGGTNVLATSRNINDLERFEKELTSEKGEFKPFKCDVADIQEMNNGIYEINKSCVIDCLINNAGITSFTLAENDDIETIKKIIDTNLTGAIAAIKAVLPGMIEKKQGTIINILSVAASKIFEKSSAYAASKAGLLAYSNVLREELREHNIRVINILPGATRTPIWPNEALEKFADRMMSPDDIANLISYILSSNTTIVPEEITLRPLKGDL